MSRVKSVGDGEHAVVCLHGWFGSADGWGFLPDVVDRQRFTYLFPEMRGYGARRDETGAFTMKEYAADALAAADERSWVDDDYLAEVGTPETPIACIVGETDPALSAEVMKQSWMQIYRDVTLVELESCGHYPMYETPVALATRIEEFLSDK